MKLRPITREGQTVGYSFYCPGCEHGHSYMVAGSMTWDFNGNMGAPSFSPSLLNTCDPHPDPTKRRCHLFLTDGKLHYGSDCSHDLAGKVVDLAERPDNT